MPSGMKRPRGTLLFAFGTLSATLGLSAYAAGLGTPSVAAVLGQPLVMTVPLSLDSEDLPAPDCVRAEVQSGDVWLAAELVRVALKPGISRTQWLVEVRTTAPVEELILQVRLTVLCGTRMVRSFTALADPPLVAAPVVGLPSTARTGAVPRPGPVPLAVVTAAPEGEGATSSSEPKKRKNRKGPRAEAKALPSETSPAKFPAPLLGWDEGTLRAPPKPASKKLPSARLELDVGGGPMLKMDLEEPIFMGTAVVADAASAAASQPAMGVVAPALPPAEAAASAALGQLQVHTGALQEANQQLQERLQRAETRANWLSGLIGALLIGAAAALVVWRRRITGKQAAPAWWAAGKSAPAPSELGLLDAVDSTPGDEPEPSYEPAPLPAVPRPPVPVDAELPLGPVEPSQLHEQTVAILPRRPLHLPEAEAEAPMAGLPMDMPLEPPRAVSVEELMDVEQQADFFVALGQEDAAIEVLMASLRGNGGQSPVPYSKLLEIYRRQGDRAAYERIRTRFNRRFNVYAPEWDMEPQAGKALEDYPDAVRELASVWPSPLDAMAVLEAMLFRRDERLALFDLPAYLDLLLLYAIAREHWQLGGANTEGVDLLLPLSDQLPTLSGEDPQEASHTRNTAPGNLGEGPAVLDFDTAEFSLDLDSAPDPGPIKWTEDDSKPPAA
jgi:pilus assembly protein FimV